MMRKEYIAILSVGPVQGFIASARKSRDLWSGSWLLSEISKAGAKSLYEQKATLIFPHIDDVKLLDKNSEFSVGNKLQAVIEAENQDELTKVIESATKAIKARFADEVQAVRSQLSNNEIRTDIWELQKDDYVEVQYAWVQLEKKYKNDVEKVGRLLASRKATRDFLSKNPNPYTEQLMLPKSSLDGVRETVLKENNLGLKARAKLGLSDSEQLDCVGVVKRLGFKEKADQFTAFSRICADSWINKLVEDGEDLTEIINIYNKLVDLDVATRIRGNNGIYRDFPYESEYLYKSRIEASINEHKNKKNDKDVDLEHINSVIKNLEALKENLGKIWETYKQPQSYGVMLLADGDKMGELIDNAKTKEDHQAITTALSAFAESVRGIMQTWQGHCIYAGGDDVLGLVPLDKAYQCADELRTSFSTALQEVSKNLEVNTPTLSVGLAICHHMTPFSVIRDYAKQAENHAKGDHIKDSEKRRNALGILLSIRSGNDTKLRLRWNDENAHHALKKWVSCYNNNELSSKVAYAIRDIDLHTKEIAKDDNDLHTKIQTAEVKRMLKQSRTEKGKEIDKKLIEKITKRAEQIGLEELANELIVARWLSAKTQQELGRI